jgi:hypothetical protein
VSPDIGSAQVVIKRERAWSGSLLPWTVWLDGEKVGTVSVGGSFTVSVPPGQHDIVVSVQGLGPFRIKSEPFSFHAEAGDRVDLITQASLMSGRPKILQPGVADSQPHLADRLQQYAERWQEDSSPDVRSHVPTPAGPAAPAPPPQPPVSGNVIEGSRYEVPMGQETRIIDNSKSSSSSTRTVRLTREWGKTCTLDTEHDMTVDGSAGLSIHVLDLKAKAERLVKDNYSVSSDEHETFEEDVTLTVAKKTKSEITFFWKEIRQKGVVQISGADFQAKIPYEIVVGLTFDQQQVDSP